MRKNYFAIFSICLLFLFFNMSLSAQSGESETSLNSELKELLKSRNFQKLKHYIDQHHAEISPSEFYYYKSHIDMAFFKGDSSNFYADQLLQNPGTFLNDSIKLEMLDVKSTNYIRDFEYKKAAEILDYILKNFTHLSDSAEIENYANVYALFKTIENVPPQVIEKKHDVSIPSHRNQFNHLITPVKCNKVKTDFIFDTGASLSVVSEKFAAMMGLKIFESNINVGTATHIDVVTKLAVADSFYVGGILFKNVVFLVTPDNQMTYPSINYTINGIIGFPVIYQMEEVRMNKNGSLFIPKETHQKQLHNMFFDGLNPVVQVISENDSLWFTLDTGARMSSLSKKYYDAHTEKVKNEGKLQISQRGGAAGIVEEEEYLLYDFPYKIGSEENTLPEIPVRLNTYSFNKHFDGNLGQDVMKQFNVMILNFEYMYVDFE